MITCNLLGRLGNNLFQIAATIGLSAKYKTDYLIPRCPSKKQINPAISDDSFPDYAGFINRLPALTDHDVKKVSTVFHEPEFLFFNFMEIPFTNNMCLSGFFQSERYFEDARDEVQDAFDIAYRQVSGLASIHVRRTDYLIQQAHHPVVSIEYLHKAIDRLKQEGIFNFQVFSDDIAWCRENIHSKNFPGTYFEFSEGRNSISDLTMMACCEHNIIAASSFSWWGAWLNRNPDKIVICPENYIGPAYLPLVARDIYPAGWIKM